MGGNYNNIIQRCIHAIGWFGSIEFNHVYREQNRIVDVLAKKYLHINTDLVTLANTPYGLKVKMHENQIGASFYRQTPLIREDGIFTYNSFSGCPPSSLIKKENIHIACLVNNLLVLTLIALFFLQVKESI